LTGAFGRPFFERVNNNNCCATEGGLGPLFVCPSRHPLSVEDCDFAVVPRPHPATLLMPSRFPLSPE